MANSFKQAEDKPHHLLTAQLAVLWLFYYDDFGNFSNSTTVLGQWYLKF